MYAGASFHLQAVIHCSHTPIAGSETTNLCHICIHNVITGKYLEFLITEGEENSTKGRLGRLVFASTFDNTPEGVVWPT